MSPTDTANTARALCQEYGLPTAAVMARLLDGFERYGAENHLATDFDAAAETLAELHDAAAFPALLIARGDIDRHDPLLRVYMLSIARATRVMERMLRGGQPPACHNDCLLCDAPCD